MKIEHNGLLLRVYLSESQRTGHAATYHAVIEALAQAGIAGAICFKGIEGFGVRRFVSSWRVVDAAIDLPILIEVVDEEEKIRAFVPQLDDLIGDGLVTLERVQTIFYRYSNV